MGFGGGSATGLVVGACHFDVVMTAAGGWFLGWSLLMFGIGHYLLHTRDYLVSKKKG
jgi:hypothetical protein